jgi:hypothetical protein
VEQALVFRHRLPYYPPRLTPKRAVRGVAAGAAAERLFWRWKD